MAKLLDCGNSRALPYESITIFKLLTIVQRKKSGVAVNICAHLHSYLSLGEDA